LIPFVCAIQPYGSKPEKGLSLLTKPKEAFVGIIKTTLAAFNLNLDSYICIVNIKAPSVSEAIQYAA